jgi:thiosulfate/3-mercaptopyruvate sulfurtransferase
VIGHGRYHFLNGGLLAWEDEQRALSQAQPALGNSPVSLQPSDHPTATREYLLKRLGAADLAIWDARSHAEYRGDKVLAAKGGHIPGAIHFEWTAGMDPQRALRIRSDIRQQLDQLGLTADKEIITHCQTHRRSGFTYLLAKALGYPRVKAYAGAWSEWGNDPDTPTEQ